MPIRLGAFEKPSRLKRNEETATGTYAKFVAEPFEIGYGHTIGNSMRRVLLSSLEGAAITSLKVDGAQHEFATIEGVVRDPSAFAMTSTLPAAITDTHELVVPRSIPMNAFLLEPP